MPQFDLAVFAPQLFWLVICFLALYFSMSKVFLPRIREVLKKREDVVNHDTLVFEDLQKQIEELNKNSNNLRSNSASQYKLAIEMAVKETVFFREDSLQNLRKKIDDLMAKSQKALLEFNEESKKDSEMLIEKLAENISQKIFNGSLTKEEIALLTDKNKF